MLVKLAFKNNHLEDIQFVANTGPDKTSSNCPKWQCSGYKTCTRVPVILSLSLHFYTTLSLCASWFSNTLVVYYNRLFLGYYSYDSLLKQIIIH